MNDTEKHYRSIGILLVTYPCVVVTVGIITFFTPEVPWYVQNLPNVLVPVTNTVSDTVKAESEMQKENAHDKEIEQNTIL